MYVLKLTAVCLFQFMYLTGKRLNMQYNNLRFFHYYDIFQMLQAYIVNKNGKCSWVQSREEATGSDTDLISQFGYNVMKGILCRYK
jgi:hypothetical protein